MSDVQHLPYRQNGLDARKFQYGSLSSLYDTLDASTTAQLEQAALCCHMRDFQAALTILESLPVEIRHHPVVAFEHSQVYFYYECFLDCARVLRDALKWAEENRPDVDEHGIYALLRVSFGRIKIYTEGDFTFARDAMREVKGWLSNLPIEQYSEVQVLILKRSPGRNRDELTSNL